jgi:lipopolysaccharide biosynthesis glycosyltransferase
LTENEPSSDFQYILVAFFQKAALGFGSLAVLLYAAQAEEIHVAFCLDNNYAEASGVAAYSLCKHLAPEDFAFIHVVMTEVLKPEHREKFQQLDGLFPRACIQIHDDARTLQQIEHCLSLPHAWQRIGIDAWPIKGMATRLVLDRILSPALHKVLYLDGDILIFSSLRDLWDKLPNEHYPLAGIGDGCIKDPAIFPSGIQKKRMRHLQVYCPNESFFLYINSGVLLLELDAIRRENLFTKTIDWLIRHRSIYPDQDAINVVFNRRTLECEGKWNTFAPFPTISKPIPGVAVLHYAGPIKPWKNPHKLLPRWWQPRNWSVIGKYLTLQAPTLWHQYRQESPWRHTKKELISELFSTWQDCRIFLAAITVIIGSSLLTIFGLRRLRSP